MAVTLSLTPAILGGIGPRVDWPKIRHESSASPGWTRWARLVVRHRVAAVVAAAVVLGLLVVAFLGIKIGAASSDSLAQSGPAVTALHRLEQGGVSTGALTPIEVLADSNQAQDVADRLGQVDGIEAALVSTGASSSRRRPNRRRARSRTPRPSTPRAWTWCGASRTPPTRPRG